MTLILVRLLVAGNFPHRFRAGLTLFSLVPIVPVALWQLDVSPRTDKTFQHAVAKDNFQIFTQSIIVGAFVLLMCRVVLHYELAMIN